MDRRVHQRRQGQAGYIWLDDLPVGLHAATPASTTVFQLYHIEADHLGTPRTIVDPNRNVAVWTWSPVGEAFGNSSPLQDPDKDTKSMVFDMRFPGQRHDPTSGLKYNYFRDYDATTGRYVESDPIGLGGGLSTYSYVGGSPLDRADWYGLAWHCTMREDPYSYRTWVDESRQSSDKKIRLLTPPVPYGQPDGPGIPWDLARGKRAWPSPNFKKKVYVLSFIHSIVTLTKQAYYSHRTLVSCQDIVEECGKTRVVDATSEWKTITKTAGDPIVDRYTDWDFRYEAIDYWGP